MGHSVSRRRSRQRRADTDTVDRRERGDERTSAERRTRGQEDHVAYDPGADRQTLSERYGRDVGREEVSRLEQLEAEHGTDQVRRWADEGMPVRVMGKPRDMRAFRGSQSGTGEQVQAKLPVSSPDDPAEREARQVAERVVDSPAGTRTGGRGRGPGADTGQVVESPGETRIAVRESGDRSRPGVDSPSTARDTSSGGGAVSGSVESTVRAGVRGSGRSLPAGTRSVMESKMGADFSSVAVHTDSTANEAARSVGAEAYTLGSDIAFAGGAYSPNSTGGRKLLAHELTHVAQQGAAPASARRATGEQVQRNVLADAASAVESAAESAAEDVEDAGEAVAGAAESAAESAKQAGESAIESAGQAVEVLSERAGDLGSRAWDLLQRNSAQVWDALQRNGRALVTMLQQGGQRVWDVLANGGGQVWQAFQSAGTRLWRVLQGTGQRLWNLLRRNTALLRNVLQQGGRQAWRLLESAGGQIWQVLQSAGGQVWPVLQGAGQRLWNLLRRNTGLFLNMLQQGGRQAWQILETGGRRVWQVIRSGGTAGQVWSVLQGTGQRLWNLLRRNTALLLRVLQRGGQQAWNVLASAGGQVWQVLQSAGGQVWRILQGTGQRLWTLLRRNTALLTNILRSGTRQAWQILETGGRRVWQVLQDGSKRVWDALRQDSRRLRGLLAANTPLLANMFHNAGPRVWNVLASLGRQLWGVLRQAGQAVWRALQTVGQQFWRFLRSVPGRLWDFIRNTGEQALLVLHSAAELVKNFLTQAPRRLIRLLRDLSRAIVAIPMWLFEGVRTLLTDPSQLGEWFVNGILDAASWVGRIITRLIDLAGVGEMFDLISVILSRETRQLTSEEQQEAQFVFGNTIDYPQIRIDPRSLISELGTIGSSSGGPLGVVTFHTINVNQSVNTSAGGRDMAFLLHEITHVSQYESVGSRYMPEAIHAQEWGGGYGYSYNDLESESFSFFNREQQASIIADYYALKKNASYDFEFNDAPSDLKKNFGGSNDYEDVYMSHVEDCRAGRM